MVKGQSREALGCYLSLDLTVVYLQLREEHTELKPTQASAERETYGQTNKFSHNRDGKTLCRHTGILGQSHLEVCRLKNHCGIKQCLRNGCTEKRTTTWWS